ncbi:MAG: flagellar hook-basal body complex protein FliE [Vicinamibacterales bacterium]
MQHAETTLHLTVQVRNKLVQATRTSCGCRF